MVRMSLILFGIKISSAYSTDVLFLFRFFQNLIQKVDSQLRLGTLQKLVLIACQQILDVTDEIQSISLGTSEAYQSRIES